MLIGGATISVLGIALIFVEPYHRPAIVALGVYAGDGIQLYASLEVTTLAFRTDGH